MSFAAGRIAGSKIVKGAVVSGLAAVAIGLAAPLSNASHEASWDEGCRGYWYSTSGHGYCYDASDFPDFGYYTGYDCNAQIDTQHYDKLYSGYIGKFDTYECRFKINKTDVHN
ncbi:hypothetical protein [Streptomyces sp. NPDC050504]|uniref:hypothetical protein n=1 Tax=Streptomyces sp. NPDC050504 TaxID=3365618 RepID=UPI0037B6D1F2